MSGLVGSRPLRSAARLMTLILLLKLLGTLELELVVELNEVDLKLVVLAVESFEVVLLFLDCAVEGVAVAFVYHDFLPLLDLVYFFLLAVYLLFQSFYFGQHSLLLLSQFLRSVDEAVDFPDQTLSA